MLDDLWTLNLALDRRFPDGQDPFRIITRLAEECGELAAEVQLWENQGVKRQKLGEPDGERMAKEVIDVVCNALQIALYYGLEDTVETRLRLAVDRAQSEGLVTIDEVARRRS